MSKKKVTPKPDTVITLTLPGEGGIVRKGTIIVKRGNLAFMGEFEYVNIADIVNAIAAGTEGVVELATTTLPDIKTTEADVYKPDQEAKRRKLVDGAPVKTSDGHDGAILGSEYGGDEDHWPVDVGRTLVGYYSLSDLTLIVPSKVTNSSAVDPATVRANVSANQRPATDISSTDETPAQLSMW